MEPPPKQRWEDSTAFYPLPSRSCEPPPPSQLPRVRSSPPALAARALAAAARARPAPPLAALAPVHAAPVLSVARCCRASPRCSRARFSGAFRRSLLLRCRARSLLRCCRALLRIRKGHCGAGNRRALPPLLQPCTGKKNIFYAWIWMQAWEPLNLC